MPFYRYYCDRNKKTVEVCHPMGVTLHTWAAVCLLARIDPGDVPGRTPVLRLISLAQPFVPKLQGLDKDASGGRLEL